MDTGKTTGDRSEHVILDDAECVTKTKLPKRPCFNILKNIRFVTRTSIQRSKKDIESSVISICNIWVGNGNGEEVNIKDLKKLLKWNCWDWSWHWRKPEKSTATGDNNKVIVDPYLMSGGRVEIISSRWYQNMN